jgi:hypothetical protein
MERGLQPPQSVPVASSDADRGRHPLEDIHGQVGFRLALAVLGLASCRDVDHHLFDVCRSSSPPPATSAVATIVEDL